MKALSQPPYLTPFITLIVTKEVQDRPRRLGVVARERSIASSESRRSASARAEGHWELIPSWNTCTDITHRHSSRLAELRRARTRPPSSPRPSLRQLACRAPCRPRPAPAARLNDPAERVAPHELSSAARPPLEHSRKRKQLTSTLSLSSLRRRLVVARQRSRYHEHSSFPPCRRLL